MNVVHNALYENVAKDNNIMMEEAKEIFEGDKSLRKRYRKEFKYLISGIGINHSDYDNWDKEGKIFHNLTELDMDLDIENEALKGDGDKNEDIASHKVSGNEEHCRNIENEVHFKNTDRARQYLEEQYSFYVSQGEIACISDSDFLKDLTVLNETFGIQGDKAVQLIKDYLLDRDKKTENSDPNISISKRTLFFLEKAEQNFHPRTVDDLVENYMKNFIVTGSHDFNRHVFSSLKEKERNPEEYKKDLKKRFMTNLENDVIRKPENNEIVAPAIHDPSRILQPTFNEEVIQQIRDRIQKFVDDLELGP